MTYHIPVLLEPSLQGLEIEPMGTYVDATFGGGGHAQKILEKLDSGKLYAFDQDPDAKNNLPGSDKLIFINENFKYLKNFLKLYHAIPVDGILADLGVSSWQIDQAVRGFSTRFHGPLDMRMDKKNDLTAAKLVNTYEQEQLMDVFKYYGELKNARKIAAEIVFHRNNKPIATTDDLKEILQKLAPRGKENKYFAQIFQALRIEVNNELEVLKDFLMQCLEVIRPGGRLVVISYHSLEDRLVKNFMRSGNFKGEADKDFFGNLVRPVQPVGKLIVPDEHEQELNPRSRSAKLRIAEIL